MSIYSISDIHVKPNGNNKEILEDFLNLNFKEDDTIILLGDIFDLVIGNHKEYYEKYHYFFKRLKQLKSLGVTIYYVEGNHDFHLELLLQKYGVLVYKEPFILNWYNGKKILFCHGDEIELGNFGYKLYKGFIRSKILNFVGNYLLPYKILNMIGERASAKSRKRNKNRYGNPQNNISIRDGFRKAAEIASTEYKTEIVIAGHSHFMDIYKTASFEYYNNGYNPYTKSYIKIDEAIEIIKLQSAT